MAKVESGLLYLKTFYGRVSDGIGASTLARTCSANLTASMAAGCGGQNSDHPEAQPHTPSDP